MYRLHTPFSNILSIFLIHWYRGTERSRHTVALLKHFSYIAGITLHLFMCMEYCFHGPLHIPPVLQERCWDIAGITCAILFKQARACTRAQARALHSRCLNNKLIWIEIDKKVVDNVANHFTSFH